MLTLTAALALGTVNLADFNSTKHKWSTENDPVMVRAGRSDETPSKCLRCGWLRAVGPAIIDGFVLSCAALLVQGVESTSTWKVDNGIGHWDGVARIVPALKAPGFTIAMTTDPVLTSFPDVSAEEGLILSLRNAGGNVSDFKVQTSREYCC